jgi:hypothetical protein
MNDDIAAKSMNEAIGTLIAKVCYPAADELGESFANKIGEWRSRNIHGILKKTDEALCDSSVYAHPRIAHHILDEGSWCGQDEVQSMWAGLLASSCTETGDDESNLVFINILRQLTSLQVNIINYVCENSEKSTTEFGWLLSGHFSMPLEDIVSVTGVDDVHRIDRELDQLRALELIFKGFEPMSKKADLTLSPFALQMYARCKGNRGSPVEFFQLNVGDS